MIVRLELATTFVISRESRDWADVVHVTISHKGQVGRGEAAPIERYGETAESALAFVERHGHLVGDDPFALEQVSALDTSVGALEQSLAKEDWKTAQEHADQASSALHRLARGPALTSLTSWDESPTVEELRSQVRAAHEQLRAAQQALVAKDTGRVHAALGGFRKSFGPVRDASRRPVR